MKIGIDLVEHQEICNREDRFIRRVLSEEEYQYYSQITSSKRKVEYVASRFACKEAIFKCTQMEHFDFREISILNDKNGAPYVLIHQKRTELQISLSHTEHYSIAVAILPLNDGDQV